MWDLVKQELMNKLEKKPDEELGEFINKINLVKPEVKHAVFIKFMNRV